MSRGINKVILIGNLGADPETKFTPSGSAVTNLSVATSESWKDKQTGEAQERTEWHRVVAFNRLAEICGEYLHKGSKVYVEGQLRTRKWQDKDGQDRYSTEIVAREMQMLDSRGAGLPGGDQAGQGQGTGMHNGYQQPHSSYKPASSTPQQPAQRPPQAQPQRQAPPQQAAMVDEGAPFDDDIPF